MCLMKSGRCRKGRKDQKDHETRAEPVIALELTWRQFGMIPSVSDICCSHLIISLDIITMMCF